MNSWDTIHQQFYLAIDKLVASSIKVKQAAFDAAEASRMAAEATVMASNLKLETEKLKGISLLFGTRKPKEESEWRKVS